MPDELARLRSVRSFAAIGQSMRSYTQAHTVRCARAHTDTHIHTHTWAMLNLDADATVERLEWRSDWWALPGWSQHPLDGQTMRLAHSAAKLLTIRMRARVQQQQQKQQRQIFILSSSQVCRRGSAALRFNGSRNTDNGSTANQFALSRKVAIETPFSALNSQLNSNNKGGIKRSAE